MFAKEVSMYAYDKGYTDSKYFWKCFFYPIRGMLMVTAMPNKRVTELLESIKPGNKEMSEVRKCPYCGTPLKENAKFCSRCGNKIAE